MTTADDDITNAHGAANCQRTLENYNDEWDIRTNLIDLLTDARHWCDANRESFAELDRIAYQHYAAEAVAERKSRA